MSTPNLKPLVIQSLGISEQPIIFLPNPNTDPEKWRTIIQSITQKAEEEMQGKNNRSVHYIEEALKIAQNEGCIIMKPGDFFFFDFTDVFE